VSKIARSGYLDALATKRGQQNVTFRVVGYGVQFERRTLRSPSGNASSARIRPEPQEPHRRRLQPDYDRLEMKRDRWRRNVLRDSGGPMFRTDDAGTTWLVGVISFGTKYCHGTSGAFIVDNAQARTFLSGFGVPLN
jgi:hypothetical protein